jgi:hypothetical protein
MEMYEMAYGKDLPMSKTPEQITDPRVLKTMSRAAIQRALVGGRLNALMRNPERMPGVTERLSLTAARTSS